MAYTNLSNPKCKNCNKTGLAILPVRYAVIPMGVAGSLPSPLGNKVIDVPLKHHKYALRTLRAGYFYIFHEKHARGSHIKWEVYSVADSGTLWQQLSPGAVKPLSEITCSREGHIIPASVITIESPEKCKRVWIAFSEHAWSADTLKAFEEDAKLRGRRMQTFLPATWVSVGGYKHGLVATKENIESVIEYKTGFDEATLNGGKKTPMISDSTGTHNAKRLEIQTTRYFAVSRAGQSETLAKVMRDIGKNSGGKDQQPMMMAVWDAVGIAHELNGFRNDTAGWIEKYRVEREQQIDAMISIEGLKQALSQKAGNEIDQSQQQIISQDSQYPNIEKRRLNAARLPLERRNRELEICSILDDWKNRKVPESRYSMRLTLANEKGEPERNVEIGKIKKEVEEFLVKRNNSASNNIERAYSGAWAKYEKLLADAPNSKKKLYEVFRANYNKFNTSLESLMDERTKDLIAWLNSSYLVDAFTEFHSENFSDGVFFDDKIGAAIFGINSSESGRKKLDEWISDIGCAENNLLWRAIALNQSAAVHELREYLQDSSRQANKNVPANPDSLLAYTQKSLKTIADLYKKFASIAVANGDASSTAGSKGFNVKILPINNFGVDRVMLTAGDKLFKLFGMTDILDRQSEYMIQHLLCIRGLVEPSESLSLIRAQTKNAPEARRLILQHLREARNNVPGAVQKLKNIHSEALEKGWEKFRATNPKAPNALRDARLPVLIMFIEGVNFGKLLIDCMQKNDAKSWWSLAASGMTITSAMFDLASVPIKNSLLKSDTISYQKIKLLGGFLSAGAAAITVVWDIAESKKQRDRGDGDLNTAYQLKATLGAINVVATGLTTFTYAAPLIEKITGNAAVGAGARALGGRATAIIAGRILCMTVGAWLTVATFGIQIFIWVLNKDQLQMWCSLSPFGVSNTAEKSYKSVKEQTAAMEKVLIDMGVIEDKTPKDYQKIYPTVEEMLDHD